MASTDEEPLILIEDLIAIASTDREIIIEVTGLDIFTKRIPGGIKQLLVATVRSETLGLIRHNMGLVRDGPNYHVTLFER